MYIKNVNFSNPKLRIYYKWIHDRMQKVKLERKNLIKTFEKLKDKIARPYHKALIRASVLNELRDKMLNSLKNIDTCNSREEFMSLYNIKPICEGCKREPIQEEAHIIERARTNKIRELRTCPEYGDHFANLFLLCATCHKIIDSKRNKSKIPKQRYNLTINNLNKFKPKIQKRIYDRSEEHTSEL